MFLSYSCTWTLTRNVAVNSSGLWAVFNAVSGRWRAISALLPPRITTGSSRSVQCVFICALADLLPWCTFAFVCLPLVESAWNKFICFGRVTFEFEILRCAVATWRKKEADQSLFDGVNVYLWDGGGRLQSVFHVQDFFHACWQNILNCLCECFPSFLSHAFRFAIKCTETNA